MTNQKSNVANSSRYCCKDKKHTVILFWKIIAFYDSIPPCQRQAYASCGIHNKTVIISDVNAP